MNVQAPRSLLVRGLSRGAAVASALARGLVRPPLLGAVYVAWLAVHAARTAPGDPQQLGAQAAQIESVV
jgi:threonine/homoserine/homoserine lactone efflux protein